MNSDEERSGLLTTSLIGVITCLGLYAIRKYIRGAQFTENVKAKDKIALVTGASSGIGKQTARELNMRGAKVYMLCRDMKKANDAKADLVKLGCDSTRLIIKELDLTNSSSIRNAAKEIENECDKIDILINNAGIMFYPKFELTVDKQEKTWQSNYFGHFLLTHLLLNLVTKSPEGRIINVSSSLHKKADSVDISVVNDKKRFNMMMPYCRSKLAQILHARELTRRIRAEDPQNKVTINVVHPGVCFTELMRYSIFSTTPIYQIITPILWFMMKSDRDGAQTTLYVALSKHVSGISGRYFGECKEHKPSPKALDDNIAAELFEQSLKDISKL